MPRLEKFLPSLRKNYIINGDMRICQRTFPFVAMTAGQYMTDRWRYSKVGAGVHSATQSTDVPTYAQVLAATGEGYYFQNSLQISLSTPDNTIAASDIYAIRQRIEGYQFANFAQTAFTLSFWVQATLPGTYCVGFNNSAPDRGYVAEYVINTTNTWEYKTITVPAPPTAGTWNYTNGIGLDVIWTLAAGTDFQVAAGSWLTTTVGNLTTINQVNGVATGANTFRITGVQINAGVSALSFRTFSNNDINSELEACQRYYTYYLDYGFRGFTTAAGQLGRFHYSYPVDMRVAPTLSTANLNSSVMNFTNQSLDTRRFWTDTTATGASSTARYIFDAFLDAEL